MVPIESNDSNFTFPGTRRRRWTPLRSCLTAWSTSTARSRRVSSRELSFQDRTQPEQELIGPKLKRPNSVLRRK